MTKKQKLAVVARLEAIRAQTELSEKAFSASCSLKSASHYNTTIAALRMGKGDKTSLDFYLAIAEAHSVSLDWLFRGIGAPKIAGGTVADPLYPSRGAAIGIHRLWMTPEAVLQRVLSEESLVDDPGLQYWLDLIRVEFQKYQQEAR